ncbi:MAG: bacteriophage holin [Pseudomonadota bacterium]|nr:MAG: bacteriophage holin [Pseudomonadota bacterium]
MILDVRAFALACAIIWGAAMFVITWWLIARDSPANVIALVRQFYIGYSLSPMGSVVGMFYGFVDGLIGGAVFAWLYNLLVARGAQSGE